MALYGGVAIRALNFLGRRNSASSVALAALRPNGGRVGVRTPDSLIISRFSRIQLPTHPSWSFLSLRDADRRVQRTWVAADPWRELRGFRAPGTGMPWVIMLGTMRGSFGKDFCAVYRRKPALIVELTGTRFSRLLITVAEPELLAERVTSARVSTRA